MEYVNNVKLFGKVLRNPEYSHEYNGIPFYSVDVETTRINNKNNAVTAIVRTYLDGKNLDADLKIGVFVEIDGKLINSKSRGMVDISVLSDSCKIISSDQPGKSEVVLVGDITKNFTNESNYKGFVNFVVAEVNPEGNKIFSTRVVAWNRLADYIFKNAKIGDHVTVKGCISNSKTNSKPDSNGNTTPIVVSEVMATYFSIIRD